MDRKFLRLAGGFMLCFSLFAASVAVWSLAIVRHGGFEFRWHRGHYEAVAKAVDAEVRLPSTLYEFAVAKGDDGQIQLLPPPREWTRGQGVGHLWAIRDGQVLSFWLETVDNGHAGEKGYAYRSDDRAPQWKADDWGEFWTLGQQLAPRWWAIAFDLG